MSTFLRRVRKVIGHFDTQIPQLTNKPVSNYSTSLKRQYANESVVLVSYPSGDVSRDNFRTETSVIDTLNDGDILVDIQCISIDAYLRVTMKEQAGLHEVVRLGDKMRSLAVGKVVESRNDAFRVGQYVSGGFPVEKYTLISQKELKSAGGHGGLLQKIESPSNDPKDTRHYLTYLGVATGCSAYAGAYYATKPIKPGDIAVVNAASGAIGSIVCQLYRNKGAKVIAITGGKDKQQYLLDTLNVYQSIDYKSEDIDSKLKEYAPEGFHVAFDNVGGKQLDVLLKHVGQRGQIVVCGAVSQYADIDNVRGPKNYLELVRKNAEMKGFNMFAYFDKLMEIRKDLLRMVQDGSLVIKEVPIYGVDNFAVAMDKLLNGDKNGKILLYP